MTKKMEYWLSGLNTETGEEVFNIMLENSDYEEDLMNSFYDKKNNELKLFGNYYNKGHMHRCEQLLQKYGLENTILDDKKDVCLRRTYEVILEKTPIKEEGIILHTDGSKSEEGTGYGLLCQDDGYEANGAMNKEATVFQAEILALKKAA